MAALISSGRRETRQEGCMGGGTRDARAMSLVVCADTGRRERKEADLLLFWIEFRLYKHLCRADAALAHAALAVLRRAATTSQLPRHAVSRQHSALPPASETSEL